MTQGISAPGTAPLEHSMHSSAAPARGQFMGLTVRTADKGAAASLSSAEEISLVAAERGGDESVKRKKEEKDKRRDGVGSRQEIVPGLPQHEAETFLRALRQAKASPQKSGQGAGRDLQNLAQKFFRDPMLQHAALAFAREHLQGEEELCALIDDALALVQREQGPQVRAGYNIQHVESPMPPQASRDCYKQNVLDYSSYENTFTALAQQFGPDDFPKAATFLRKALGADMKALTPSTEKARLQEVAEGLYMVQNLASLYVDAGKLTTDTGKRFGTVEPHARQVMEMLLHCKDDTTVTEPQLRRQAAFCISKNPSRDAVFVRGLRELARALPLKLYPSPEQRLRVLHVLQEVLDKAIEREEEALA